MAVQELKVFSCVIVIVNVIIIIIIIVMSHHYASVISLIRDLDMTGIGRCGH